MRIHTEEAFQHNAVDVWVLDHLSENAATTARILRLGGDFPRWEECPIVGERPAPTMRLPNDVARELAGVLAGLTPPDRAQGRHLEDAVEVRDKLLALVELSHEHGFTGDSHEAIATRLDLTEGRLEDTMRELAEVKMREERAREDNVRYSVHLERANERERAAIENAVQAEREVEEFKARVGELETEIEGREIAERERRGAKP